MASQADFALALDALTAEVAQTVDVETSAITFIAGLRVEIQRLADELAAAGVPQESVDRVLALGVELDTRQAAMSAAIAATPPTA